MTLRRTLLTLRAVAALGIVPVRTYADTPVLTSGDHVDHGLPLTLDGYGRYSTFFSNAVAGP